MAQQYTLKIKPEQAKEMPMVDLAFELLKSANTPFYYRDLMTEIAKIKGLSDKDVMNVIAQLYTEINIDGRFACVGSNLWGLKRWYPVEKSDDAIGSSKRPRIINDDDDDLDDELYIEEEEQYVEEDDFGELADEADPDFIDEPLVEEAIEVEGGLDDDTDDDLEDDLDTDVDDSLQDDSEDVSENDLYELDNDSNEDLDEEDEPEVKK
jgi:DNA-directed RNA polymerase subunit delta